MLTLASFIPLQLSEGTGYWEVMENYEAGEREGFLSVRAGQLVEVLDDSRSSWMVLTIAMTTEDLQTEGFLPAHILRPAGMSMDIFVHVHVHVYTTACDVIMM